MAYNCTFTHCWLLLNLQVSSADDMPCPATVLVRLALQKWIQCRVRADNISVVVILLENCKSLVSSAFKHNCSFEEDRLALDGYPISSISDTPIRNPVSACHHVKKQLYKTHHSKKLHARKPLALINDTHYRSSLAKRRKQEFKIPTTPEQRSAYWSRRKQSKMIENLPLDLFVYEKPTDTNCAESVDLGSFKPNYRLPLSVNPIT